MSSTTSSFPAEPIHLAAPKHFPIKLTKNNFLVWRRQVQTTLIGLDLLGYVDGTITAPSRFLDAERKQANPAYTVWYRQDAILVSAILGSCSEEVQPLIALAATSNDAWNRLTTNLASMSRGRVISLKAKLAKNPRGNRSIESFISDMTAIAGELALAGSPVADDDLVVNIMTQLGEDYSAIYQSLRGRTSLSLEELSDILTDCEREIKDRVLANDTVIATANYANRMGNRMGSGSGSDRGNNNSSRGGGSFRGGRNGNRQAVSGQTQQQQGRNGRFCRFCEFSGHDTRFCRKLQRFLRENNCSFGNNSGPTAHATTSPGESDSQWLVDSGASHHVTNDLAALNPFMEYGGPDEIRLGNGKTVNISHTGRSSLPTSTRPLLLSPVLCAPKLQTNLISVSQLCRTNNISVEFFSTHFLVKDARTGTPLLRGLSKNNLYAFPRGLRSAAPSVQATSVAVSSVSDLHHRLGHPNNKTLGVVLRQCDNLSKFESVSKFHCVSCNINKSHKQPFSFNTLTSAAPLDLIYTDVWSTSQCSIDGCHYYVLFVDHFTKYIWWYPMKHKSDVFSLFSQFKRLVENMFNRAIKSLFSDNGGEFIKLIPLLNSHGISHFTTPPYTPEQNGTAERRHRHIVETGLSLLHTAGLPLSFWTYAFHTAVYLINRLPTPILTNKSPYESLFIKSPDYAKLKPFGCLCFPWLRPYHTTKLEPRSAPCVFLGYSSSQSAYKCYELSSAKIYVSRHVKFIPDVFPYSASIATSTVAGFSPPPSLLRTLPPTLFPSSHQPPVQNHPPSPPPSETQASSSLSPLPVTVQPAPSQGSAPASPQSSPSSESLPSPSAMSQPTRPVRERRLNPRYFNDYVVNTAAANAPTVEAEPLTYLQARKSEKWRTAMDAEHSALQRNNTWTLVPRNGHRPIHCKWVFRIKRKSDGSIERYKARLVAKGFLQQPGRDYFETFSPVTKPVTVRLILTLAISRGWSLRQLDVNNAFLNGTLQEEVFMEQPSGYRDPANPDYICKLNKAIYGLKQAPRAWYLALAAFLVSFGFRKSRADASLFIYGKGSTVIYFLVYVDDIVVTSNDLSLLDVFVLHLSRRFSLKDLGRLHHFLGVEVVPVSGGVFLSQRQYIHSILEEHNMADANAAVTPLSPTTPLHLSDGTGSADSTKFRKLIGSLQYLALTRPDISFAVNKLSQFMHAPTVTHWQAAKRVMRYLCGTLCHGLFLKASTSLPLTIFSDSDWGGVHDGGRSTTAYVIFLGSTPISWKSARQKTVSRSSTEAEYRALAHATAEALWISHLLCELGLPSPRAPLLYCDNLGATYVCKNPVFHSRMKHLALDYFFVRDLVAAGRLHVRHIPSSEQTADLLTKPLGTTLFQKFRNKIGVSDGTPILRGRNKAT